MYHHLPIPIPFGENSVALCSFDPPKKLVLLVHGFNGSSVDTWDELDELITKDSNFQNVDVIFYGYDSLRTQARNMAISFFDVLDAAYEGNLPFPERQHHSEFNYESIFIVAHSLGAVISRLALLRAYDSDSSWSSLCKLVLFAPAHFGSRILDNFKECFTGSKAYLKGFAQTRYPILIDLKHDSEVLQEMFERCGEILAAKKGEFLKAAGVCWAEKENVVVSKRFLEDKLEDQITNTTHVSVCKINYQTTEPMTFLLQALTK